MLGLQIGVSVNDPHGRPFKKRGEPSPEQAVKQRR